jgi:hypothetical protein
MRIALNEAEYRQFPHGNKKAIKKEPFSFFKRSMSKIDVVMRELFLIFMLAP